MPEFLRSVVLDPAKLKIDHEDYSSGTNAEARVKIKRILDLTNFAIATEEISTARASQFLPQDATLPSRMATRAIIHGVSWVMANSDGTDDTGVIKYGKPVVFDTKTGKSVTGINDKWSPGEYRILGTALDELESGYKLIPILLGSPPMQQDGPITCRAKVKTGTWPSIQTWSEATPDSDEQQSVWEFELPKSHEFKEADSTKWLDDIETAGESHWEGSGEFVKAFNLDRTYVYKNSLVTLTKQSKGGAAQYYFNFQMAQTLTGTLDGNLTKESNALMTIVPTDKTIQGTKVKVHDRFLSTGKKLATGTKVLVQLMRQPSAAEDEPVNEPFIWRYVVTQSNNCPVNA